MEVSEGYMIVIYYVLIFLCLGRFIHLIKFYKHCIADIYFQVKNGEDILQSLTSENNFVVWPCLTFNFKSSDMQFMQASI